MELKIFNFNFSNLILWAIVYGVIFVIQLNSFLSFAIVVFPLVGVFWACFINRKFGFLLYVLSLFIFDDHSYSIDKTVYFASIDTYTLGGQTISKLWTFFWVVLIFMDLLKGRVFIVKSSITTAMLYLLVVSLINGVLNYNFIYLKEFVNDGRMFVNYFVGFMGVSLYLTNINDILIMIRLLGLVLMSKMIIFICFVIILLQTSLLHTISSDTGFYLLPTFLIIYSILSENNSKWISYLGITLCILLLGMSASRGKIIILLFQVLLYAYSIGKLIRSPLYLLLLIIPVSLIPLLSQDIYQFLIWKLTSFSVDPEKGISTYIRYIEWKNIISMNLSSVVNFLFGTGLGGYWDSSRFDYGITLFNIDAYPDEWIRNDKFFKPHGNTIFFLLKFGIVGFAYFYAIIFSNLIKRKRFFKKHAKLRYSEIEVKMSIAIVTGIIALSVVAFSSKLQFFFGIFSAFLAYLAREKRGTIEQEIA